MTKAQAMKLARGKWGELAELRHHPRAGTKATRDAAWAALREMDANKPTDKDALATWREERSRLVGQHNSYRYQIGVYGDSPFGPILGIRGVGDSWEDACRMARLIP
jgi:hypothetical protein